MRLTFCRIVCPVVSAQALKDTLDRVLYCITAKGAYGNVTEEPFVLTFVALQPCACVVRVSKQHDGRPSHPSSHQTSQTAGWPWLVWQSGNPAGHQKKATTGHTQEREGCCFFLFFFALLPPAIGGGGKGLPGYGEVLPLAPDRPCCFSTGHTVRSCSGTSSQPLPWGAGWQIGPRQRRRVYPGRPGAPGSYLEGCREGVGLSQSP